MTREEQIGEAYQDYLGLGGVLHSNPWFVFKSGAEWADEHPINVWHDASEEPLLEENEILFINEHGVSYISLRFGGTFSYMLEDLNWEKYVDLLRISKWVYVKDLLPKTKEL